MEMVEKLPYEYIEGRKVYKGVFVCGECGEQVIKPCSSGKIAKSCGCLKKEQIKIAKKKMELSTGAYAKNKPKESREVPTIDTMMGVLYRSKDTGMYRRYMRNRHKF